MSTQTTNTGNRSSQPQNKDKNAQGSEKQKQYAEGAPDDSKKFGEMGGSGRPGQGSPGSTSGTAQRTGQPGNSSSTTRTSSPSDTQRPSKQDESCGESCPSDHGVDETTGSQRRTESGQKSSVGSRKVDK